MPDGLNLYLAEPRGFCAGVRRAIALVEEALERYGAPVYVRHEIVHNQYVINDLRRKGAVFVEETAEADPARPLVISAHGAGLAVVEDARHRHKVVIDATCPLVEKIHREIKKYAAEGREIIVIGKAAHPEIIGTVGQLPGYGKIHVINSAAEAESLRPQTPEHIAFVSQTTLSVDETADIIAVLKRRFPAISGLKSKDICYATTNRQQAVKTLAAKAPCILVLGSKNSSNSNQLRRVALQAGAEMALLINDAAELDWQAVAPYNHIGISAGASAPEYLVEDLLKEFARRYDKINVHRVIIAEEKVNFKL